MVQSVSDGVGRLCLEVRCDECEVERVRHANSQPDQKDHRAVPSHLTTSEELPVAMAAVVLEVFGDDLLSPRDAL